MSENTIEEEPEAAVAIFGDRIDLARRFTNDLATQGEERGLIGPLEVPRLWQRHILNSAIAAPFFSGKVADVGSGAGLPGIPLAIARPDVQFTLIEPMARRVDWLNEQKDLLGLDNVTVVRDRAEDWRGGAIFDSVTARAVSAFRTLIPLTAPLVRDGGELLFLKGVSAANEIGSAEKSMRKYRVSDAEVVILGEALLSEVTRLLKAKVRA